MNEENIYTRLTDILDKMGGSFNILEEEIDVDLQMEYFEFSKNFKHSREVGEIMNSKDELFDKHLKIDDKKRRLVELAAIDDLDAFKTISKYLENPESKMLKSWAILAYQESKMLLESRLLDENQVFIFTGLGGKDGKFRYFVVLLSRDKSDFSELQKSIIEKEFKYILNKQQSEIEQVEFFDKFATILALIPLKTSVKKVLEDAIFECNQLGNFVDENFIVTNIKKLTPEDIFTYLEEKSDN